MYQLIGLKGNQPNQLLVKNLGVKNKKIAIPVIILLVISVALCLCLGSILSNSQTHQKEHKSNTQPKSIVYGKEPAIEIALPFAQTYAQEYNRTLTTTKATLRETDRPYWFIEIGLETVENPESKYHLKTSGYEVTVWADTGEIYHQCAIPPYSEQDFKISLEKAIEIAYPLTQVYAQNNNRTIATTVTGWAGYVDSRPCWQIDISFETMNGDAKALHLVRGHPYGNQAYAVSIWGDTGKVLSQNVQGYY